MWIKHFFRLHPIQSGGGTICHANKSHLDGDNGANAEIQKEYDNIFFFALETQNLQAMLIIFTLKNLVPNFCSKSSWISFCLMLHHWCPCCQLGWRIICIIHQKPGVDLTLKQFSRKETYWQPFSSLRFYQKGLEHWIGISFYCNFLKSLEEEYQTFDIWSLTK